MTTRYHNNDNLTECARGSSMRGWTASSHVELVGSSEAGGAGREALGARPRERARRLTPTKSIALIFS